ncbi:putative c6 finger domain [Phaeomoniella chlamydospora]|uniref:Putative c6 finger domain n=1 Tax=Phaeomoniella chlamydospora TaxID=158046 RepID=A0A0G2HKR6_PHACM|nr:putative c6 finger domain [Phaeomoniella chlamydospora]
MYCGTMYFVHYQPDSTPSPNRSPRGCRTIKILQANIHRQIQFLDEPVLSMTDNLGLSSDDLVNLEYDSRTQTIPFIPRQSWPLSMEQQRHDIRRGIAPLQNPSHAFDNTLALDHQQTQFLGDWRFQTLPAARMTYADEDPTIAMSFGGTYGMAMPTSPVNMMPTSQASPQNRLSMDAAFLPMQQAMEGMPFTWPDFHQELNAYQATDAFNDMTGYGNQPSTSPTDTYLEVRSLTSSSSNEGWSAIENRQSMDAFERGFYIDPSQTLHTRTLSESSYSDLEQQSHVPYGGHLEMIPQALSSPGEESNADFECTHFHGHRLSIDNGSQSSAAVSPIAMIRPMPVSAVKKSTSPARSPTSQSSSSSSAASSPTSRKPSRKSPIAKATEKVIKKASQSNKSETTEKKVGRRKGPLRPEQRKQAGEIRKLRACLRCKFLKKTCDKGEPCAGCQPSHARLWQVPCTRIDIKEIGNFIRDWRVDFERHATLGFAVNNIKGFSDSERILYITHGYGHILPVTAREVYVVDENCFGMDWVEVDQTEEPMNSEYEVPTAKLSAGTDGISNTHLHEYLDLHIDTPGCYEAFIDEYFQGTPFLSEMLHTAFRYYQRTQIAVIRKVLKLVLAYNLTLHITMVEGIPDEEGFVGKIEDDSSKWFGKTMAPVMINFSVKCAMSDMWRELQKSVLEELSALYSSVYSGDKLKNWPTIFILASVLLAVWECMQFDCHYREPDQASVEKFCNDMESTPVGVIVGLFQAISQKLPAFTDWDTSKHHHLLASNDAVCDTMTEVREHVARYEDYLRGRPKATFDSSDFDCLSNKFLSKLVIRAN